MEELRNSSSFDERVRQRAPSPSVLVATDATLLLASLEQAPLEDEAEAALIEVLEQRRQVTFSDNDMLPSPRRRTRTASDYTSGNTMDFLSQAHSNSPVNPSYSATKPSPTRPPLAKRAVSHGHHRRHRSRGGGGSRISAGLQSVGLRDSFHGAGSTTSTGGIPGVDFDITTDMKDNVSVDNMEIPSAKSGESQGGSSSSPTGRPSLQRPILQKSKSARFSTHRRVISALPAGLEHNGVVNDTMTGLTDAGERSRRIALALKTFDDDSNFGDTPSTHVAIPTASGDMLPDLLSIMEAKREQENESVKEGGTSRGSRGSRGSLQGGSVAGAGGSRAGGSRNGSRFSGGRANSGSLGGTRSKGESSGARRGRPFFGVTSPWANDDLSNVETLLQAAERVQELCQIPEDEEQEEEALVKDQNETFLSQLAASHPEIVEPTDLEGEGAQSNEQTPMLQQARVRRKTLDESPSNKWCYNFGAVRKVMSWVDNARKQIRLLAAALDIPFVGESVWSFIQNDVTTYLIPALAVAVFSFYHLGNPSPKFFANEYSYSEGILFLMRNYITLQLAYASEYIVVDVLAMRSTLLLELIGPLATLYLIQAKGWPLVAVFWGMWSLALIQNVDGWLSWTNIEMFIDEKNGIHLAESETYIEILASVVMVGIATTIKRTVLAMYLGKRIYYNYKKKVERCMLEMLLMTEVSDLSQAIDDFEFVDQAVEKKQPSGTKESSIAQTLKNTTMSDIVKKQLTRTDTVMSENDSESEDEDNNEKRNSIKQIASAKHIAQTLKDKARKGTATSENDSESEDEDNNNKKIQDQSLDYSQEGEPQLSPQISKSWSALRRDESVQSDTSDVSETRPSHPVEAFPASDGPPPVQNVNEPVRNLLRGTSTTSQIKSLLYRWEEPVNKQDKEIDDPTIHEILQFRRALSFLEDTHPFGLSFGPANNRDTCIKSAKTLYRRLLALTPGSTVLHFDVIGVLAYNADGSFDERKAKELVKLFRPDKNDEISLLAFVQSCDTAYKKLRYLRAGVGNSTSIDDVLENFFNGAFTFCLGLGVMAIMQMNPWTLLVSMSTILVSFAFAFGQSVAQIIEGCIMIAVRRPFDLGDRISIADASDKPENSDPGYGATWLVEDCNLFTTTLRLSKSNEIATVKNGSIASNKIINHNRSLRALVNIVLSMKCSVTQEEAMIVKSAIEQYIRDNPRTWSTLINFRIIEMDPCNDVIRYAVRVQHQRSWQDQQPILTARGELLKFATEVLIQLGIQYETKPASIHDVFVKELPESNVTQTLLSQPILG